MKRRPNRHELKLAKLRLYDSSMPPSGSTKRGHAAKKRAANIARPRSRVTGQVTRRVSFTGICLRCGMERPPSRHHCPSQAMLKTGRYDELVGFTVPVCNSCHNILDEEVRGPEGFKKQYRWIASTLVGLAGRSTKCPGCSDYSD